MSYRRVTDAADRVAVGAHVEGDEAYRAGAYCLPGKHNFGVTYSPPEPMDPIQEVRTDAVYLRDAISRLLANVILGAKMTGQPLGAVGIAEDHFRRRGRSNADGPLVRDLRLCLQESWPMDVSRLPIVVCGSAEAMAVAEIDAVTGHGWRIGEFVTSVVGNGTILYGARARIIEGGVRLSSCEPALLDNPRDPEAVARQILTFARRFRDPSGGKQRAQLVLGGQLLAAYPEIVNACQERVEELPRSSWLRGGRPRLPNAGDNVYTLGAAAIALEARTEPHQRHIWLG